MIFDTHYEPDICHLLPSVAVIAQRCHDKHCRAVHGYTLALHWWWWGVTLTYPR